MISKALGPALALALVVGGAAPAHAAQRLETWTLASRFVDFAAEPHIAPPAGQSVALHVNVLLPDGYDGRRHFPVLYLFHGHGGNYDSWRDPHGEDLLRIAAGFPGIVVMPEAGNGWCANWWKGGRRSPAWERFHLDELIPTVERRLRVRAGRRWHAIAGLSMGGECAAYYATQRPGYFGSAAPFSGPVSIRRTEWPAAMDTQGESHVDVFGDPQAQAFYWQGHDATALVDNLRATRLFIAVGDGTPQDANDYTDGYGVRGLAELELRQQAVDFEHAARAAGVDTTTYYYPGVHKEEYWQEDLRRAIAWDLFGPVPAAPRAWTYSTVSQHAQAWDLQLDFAAPPDALETFTRDGRVLRATGAGTVRVKARGARAFVAALPFTRRIPRPRHR